MRDKATHGIKGILILRRSRDSAANGVRFRDNHLRDSDMEEQIYIESNPRVEVLPDGFQNTAHVPLYTSLQA